ncbi:MAG: cytochrome c [Proteobacteria bacterium]|nr:cytochrome c [Pseudomonadota bacterium]
MQLRFGKYMAAALLAAGVLAGSAQAQERMVEGEMVGEAVKYRVNIMRAMGAHMGAMGAILQSKVENKGDLAAHGAALAGLAGMWDDLFPKGSDAGSKLKPEFFNDGAMTAGIIKALQDASLKVASASASGDMAGVGQNIGAMGAQCGACHKAYRLPQS